MLSHFSEGTSKQLIDFALRGGTGWHITRKYMYQKLADQFAGMDSSSSRCLSISHSVFFGKILGLRNTQIVEANYPQHNIIDLQSFKDEEFDFCISDQVFEHIEGDPFTAFKETARVVRPGGLICHTTCFVTEIHGAPSDFWRFTPGALSLLANSSACEVVDIGSWGNREAWALINAGYRMAKIPDDPANPLYQLAMRNEVEWPIVTWIIARKL